MPALNVEYPDIESVEQMGVLELRRNFRFLPVPETQEQCDVLNRIAAKIQESGLSTLPIRMDRGLDGDTTLGTAQEPWHGG